jgi:CRP/FNR family transcriptional regulator, cyclic AMP receptor protein
VTFFEAAYAASERPVRLIDVDPELFEGLNGAAPRRGVHDLTVAVVRVPAGPWRVELDRVDDRLGMLVLEGLIARTVEATGQRRAELLGPGDLIRPWDTGDDELARLRADVGWTVLEPARLADLDGAFAGAACRAPEVFAELLVRAIRRSQRMALQMAIGDVRRVDERLLALFAHLGDRWGRVTPDGIHVPVRLTHELIALLIGAQRPTVTTGLGELRRQGRLVKRADRTWLLPGGSP